MRASSDPTEWNGVKVGQRVRDLDGRPLGKVTRLFRDGFAAQRGLPILFRHDYVLRYEEVRGVRDGELVVARSERDLHALAAGAVPPSWRVPVPPDFPPAATPPEARLLIEDLRRGAIVTGITRDGQAPTLPGEREASFAPRDERERRDRAPVSGEPTAAAPR
jgi:hypothetical protein